MQLQHPIKNYHHRGFTLIEIIVIIIILGILGAVAIAKYVSLSRQISSQCWAA